MQDDIVVSCITVVSMGIPVASADVYLYVASQQAVANAYSGIEEVGACIGVEQTCVYDFNRLSVGRTQFSSRQYAVFPAVLQQFLHSAVSLFATHCFAEVFYLQYEFAWLQHPLVVHIDKGERLCWQREGNGLLFA